jgi:hypothetical protein
MSDGKLYRQIELVTGPQMLSPKCIPTAKLDLTDLFSVKLKKSPYFSGYMLRFSAILDGWGLKRKTPQTIKICRVFPSAQDWI